MTMMTGREIGPCRPAELTNVGGGGIKSPLAGTPWGFTQITVPLVIVG